MKGVSIISLESGELRSRKFLMSRGSGGKRVGCTTFYFTRLIGHWFCIRCWLLFFRFFLPFDAVFLWVPFDTIYILSMYIV